MKNSWKLLFNPFAKIAGWKGFALGLVVIVVTVVVGWSANTVFPAMIDGKIVSNIELKNVFAVEGISRLVAFVVIFGTAILMARKTRVQDILAAITISRFPFIFAALSGFFLDASYVDGLQENIASQIASGNIDMASLAPVLLSGTFMMIMAVWSVVLLFNGYKTATGLKGTKLGMSFALSVFAAEVISLVIFA